MNEIIEDEYYEVTLGAGKKQHILGFDNAGDAKLFCKEMRKLGREARCRKVQ